MSKEQKELLADFSYRNHNEEKEFELEFDVEDMFKEWDEMQEDLVNSPPHYNKGGVECTLMLSWLQLTTTKRATYRAT